MIEAATSTKTRIGAMALSAPTKRSPKTAIEFATEFAASVSPFLAAASCAVSVTPSAMSLLKSAD